MSKTDDEAPFPAKPAPTSREARLAQALRANLKRRKAGEGSAPPRPED
jgi:hypothetical protein